MIPLKRKGKEQIFNYKVIYRTYAILEQNQFTNHPKRKDSKIRLKYFTVSFVNISICGDEEMMGKTCIIASPKRHINGSLVKNWYKTTSSNKISSIALPKCLVDLSSCKLMGYPL